MFVVQQCIYNIALQPYCTSVCFYLFCYFWFESVCTLQLAAWHKVNIGWGCINWGCLHQNVFKCDMSEYVSTQYVSICDPHLLLRVHLSVFIALWIGSQK